MKQRVDTCNMDEIKRIVSIIFSRFVFFTPVYYLVLFTCPIYWSVISIIMSLLIPVFHVKKDLLLPITCR